MDLSFEVGAVEAGERLDRFLTAALEESEEVGESLSRGAVQRLIRDGNVLVDGVPVSSSLRLQGGEEVSVHVPADEGPQPEDIPVPIVYEDGDLIVVDKPCGMVVHPGAGNESGTLVNALLARGIAGGEDPARPGVVHRLDRDTSGLLMLARNEPAYGALVELLRAREVERVYRALVVGGGLPETGTVDSPVGRDPDHPVRMTAGIGKSAITHFEVLCDTGRHSMLRIRLQTGRTHQIRVHLAAIGYPVYADPLYGQPVPEHRIWLHAERLAFTHPTTGEPLEFTTPVPEELRAAASGLDDSLPLG